MKDVIVAARLTQEVSIRTWCVRWVLVAHAIFVGFLMDLFVISLLANFPFYGPSHGPSHVLPPSEHIVRQVIWLRFDKAYGSTSHRARQVWLEGPWASTEGPDRQSYDWIRMPIPAWLTRLNDACRPVCD